AAAQMNAFHARAVDEDLAQGARPRQQLDVAAREFHREIGLGRAARAVLEIIGAQRAFDETQEATQDAVLVEALDIIERAANRRDAAFGFLGGVRSAAWIEARLEKRDELGRDAAMAGERIFHIGLAEGRA